MRMVMDSFIPRLSHNIEGNETDNVILMLEGVYVYNQKRASVWSIIELSTIDITTCLCQKAQKCSVVWYLYISMKYSVHD